MNLSITITDKKPLEGIAGRFGIEAKESVRGLRIPISEQAYYASLTDGLWRYWVRMDEGSAPATFAGKVGRLVPVQPMDFMARLNDHATGPIQRPTQESPLGEAIVFDLPDVAVVERFALACAVGESLSGSEHVLFARSGQSGSAAVIQDALPNLNVNLSLWAVAAPGQALVFLPNALLLRRDRHQWAVPYAEVAVRLDTERAPGASSDICLALSDQRVRLVVSDPRCALRAVRAIERLIQFEAGKRAHLGPKPSKESGRSRVTRRVPRSAGTKTSCGRIVITPKDSSTPKGRVTIRIKVDAETEAPGPDPDQGLTTPTVTAREEALIFCEASGLVFANESPQATDSKPQPTVDRLRSAVGALLAYVAKASDGFTAPEQRVIHEILQLPAGFQIEQRYSAVLAGPRPLEHATRVVKERAIEVRRRVLRDCERVANADGSVTPLEQQRLGEIRAALDL